MSTNETWYDRQANISKLITYAAILILLASVSWAVYAGYLYETHRPELRVLAMAMISAIGGTAVAAMLVGMSAIIDLMIVHAEALRTGKGH